MRRKPHVGVTLTQACFVTKSLARRDILHLLPRCGLPDMMIFHVKICTLMMIGIFPLAMVSCSSGPNQRPVRGERVLYRWYDDGGPGKVNIHISLLDQIAEFDRGGRKIGWCYVATGREGFGTKPGDYRITEKIVDKYSNRYGWIEDEFGNVVIPDARYNERVPEGMVYVPAPMPYWMRLTSYGIGMHGGLIPEPGQPASHGCIRLPKYFVPILFDSVEVGTPVTISEARASQGPQATPALPPQFDEGNRPMELRPQPVARPAEGFQGY